MNSLALFLGGTLALAGTSCGVERGRSGAPQSDILDSLVGSVAEVMLRSELIDGGRALTPPNTSGSLERSETSITGTIVSSDEDWIVVEVEHIRVDRLPGGAVKTYGDSGVRARTRYLVPRENILAVRVPNPSGESA